MSELKAKYASESVAEQVHVLTMETLNGNQRLAGPQLFLWIDEVAVVVARRHSGSDVTTVKIENLEFLKPAINKDTVIVKGKIISVGRSSMYINVEAFSERFSGEQTKIATAKVLMVALDENEVPHPVPELIIEE